MLDREGEFMKLDKIRQFFKPKVIHGKTTIQIEIDTLLNKLKKTPIETLEINGINELYLSSYFEKYNEYCNILHSPDNIVGYSTITAVQWSHFIEYNNNNLKTVYDHIEFFNTYNRFSNKVSQHRLDRVEKITFDFLKTIEICL